MSAHIPSLNPFKQTDKTKNWFQNGTDTLTEVIGLFIIAVLIAGGLFALFEGKDFFASIWWAIVTGFTVGYGDIAPVTMGGRIVGVALMTFSTWVILPLIIVTFIKKHSPDRNEFTDDEQKEILRLLRSLDSKSYIGMDFGKGESKTVTGIDAASKKRKVIKTQKDIRRK